MLLGAHESIAGGHYRSLERAARDGCETLQIFTKNANRWKARDITHLERDEFIKARRRTGIGPVAAHDSYLINLATPKDDLYERSKEAFFEEMKRAEFLGLQYLIFHPGAHTGSGTEAGVERVIDALSEIMDATPGYRLKVLVETTAGQGTSLGSTFEEIADILEGVGMRGRMGVCFDTCHAFAAGHDIRTEEEYSGTMGRFDSVIGLGNLLAFHLNDAVKDLGSRVDRHAQIGEGKIGLGGFSLLVNDRRFAQVPGILETPPLPTGEDSYQRNLAVLRGLLK